MSNERSPKRYPTTFGDRNENNARRRTPASGVPEHVEWDDEPTGVGTDARVFRALKSLKSDLEDSKAEAARSHGELRGEVKEMGGEVKEMKDEIKGLAVGHATVAGKLDVLLAMQRDRRDSSPRESVKEKLAEAVLSDRARDKKFRHKLILLIAGGVFSSASVGALIHWALR